MGEEVVFTNCASEKLCSSENAIFIVLPAKHSSCNKKHFMLKNKKYENSGLFEHGKRCFCLFFFRVLMLFWFVFCVSGKVAKC